MKAKRPLSAKEAMKIKRKNIEFSSEFREAFGMPESKGCWFIYGDSGQGKSSFSLSLAKELSRFYKIAHNTIEEGLSSSFVNKLTHYKLDECRNYQLYDSYNIDEIMERLKKRGAPDVIITDSIQFFSNEDDSPVTYSKVKKLMKDNPNKLFIFISQAKKGDPIGAVADKLLFHADLKIFVKGFRAFSKGRFIGPLGYYDINKQLAEKYHGNN